MPDAGTTLDLSAPEVQAAIEKAAAEKVASETEGLKRKVSEVLSEKKKLAALYEGIDPEEARSHKQTIADLEAKAKAQAAGITSEQLQKLRLEAKAEFEKEHGPKFTKLTELERENRALKLDNVVKGQMAKAGARAERIDALYRLSNDRFDLTDDGKPMVKDTTKEVEKFIAEDLKEQYPEFFNGSGSSGSGASSTAGAGGGAVRADITDPIALGKMADAYLRTRKK